MRSSLSDRAAGLFVAHASRTGDKRQGQGNEDAALARPLRYGSLTGVLCLVADGVGGRPRGAAAARAAVRAVAAFGDAPAELDPGELLLAAFGEAHQAVRRTAGDDGGEGGASTLVAAVLRRDELWVANVGDSRAYLLEPGRALVLLTRDHSWVQEQVREGALRPEEAADHPWRRMITRCLGAATAPEADLYHRTVGQGARLLLCSDGLREVVDDAELGRVLGRAVDPEDAVAALMELADRRGAGDDVTLCVAELAEPAPLRGPQLPWRVLGTPAWLLGLLAATLVAAAVALGGQ
ncbi:MAG: protein phosphatase 2C domain-containing protein [Chloroflexi bacterium]|nr:protein phosphatase 2C domain-containing protein [Chloroflexota bacterium]